MILINIETLSDSELKYIAKHENIEGWESLEREDLIETLQDYFEDDLDRDRGVSSEKFFKTLTSTPSEDVIRFPGTSDLPDKYNETSVHIVLRDMNWAYVFWNISNEKRAELETLTDFRLMLRIKTDKEGLKNNTFDIEVSLSDDNWNIELPFNDASYFVELLVCTDKEERLCKSNSVSTYSSYFSTHIDELNDKKQRILSLEPLFSKDGSFVINRSFEEIFNSKEGR